PPAHPRPRGPRAEASAGAGGNGRDAPVLRGEGRPSSSTRHLYPGLPPGRAAAGDGGLLAVLHRLREIAPGGPPRRLGDRARARAPVVGQPPDLPRLVPFLAQRGV